MKKKVLIIGCGFAGLSAANFLSRYRPLADVTVVDKKKTFDFLPMLPDIIGRGVRPECLAYPLSAASRHTGFNFVNEEVVSVDLSRQVVSCSREELGYDYLLVCSGSETNFYGNGQLAAASYKLDSVSDAEAIAAAVRKGQFNSYIIAGGGYTGVEIAAALRRSLDKKKLNGKIAIVERAPAILGPLPEWIKGYVRANLGNNLGIDIITNAVIDKASGGTVHLSNGQIFERTMLVWVAGVKTAAYVAGLDKEKNPQGRLKADEYLRINNNCFVAGDCAYVRSGDIFLRMAVQFAISQAGVAAMNIVRHIRGAGLSKYRPLDLGYIVPMANNRSCGRVLGMNVTGKTATLLHFLMCIYRACGLKNKLGIIKDLMKGGAE